MFEGFSGIRVRRNQDEVADLSDILTDQVNKGNKTININVELLEVIDERVKKLSLELLSATQGGSWGTPAAPAGDVNVA